MKQLFHLCGTWQQQQWKRCIRLPLCVLFHWAASPAFLQPVKLPWQQSGQSGWGMVKRNVQWRSVRKLQKESIQWLPALHEKMSINQASGQALTATLRACLPRHNAIKSKVQLSNMATFALNFSFLFSLSHFPNTAVHDLAAFSADLILISSWLARDCDALSYQDRCKACQDFL